MSYPFRKFDGEYSAMNNDTSPTKITPATETSSAPEVINLTPDIIELVDELKATVRSLNTKRSTKKQLRRSLTVIDDVLADLKKVVQV
jgi:hypothetical protein